MRGTMFSLSILVFFGVVFRLASQNPNDGIRQPDTIRLLGNYSN